MRFRVVALLLTAVVSPLCIADPLQSLDECIARLDPVADSGYARIAARCPDLTQALKDSPAAQWLPHGWDGDEAQLNARGLARLRVLLGRESVAHGPAAHAPDVRGLAPVLASVSKANDAGAGWWSRLKERLRQLLASSREQDDGWFSGVLRELDQSKATMRAIVWITLAAVVAFACWMVFHELRAAGVFRDRDPNPLAGDGASGRSASASTGQHSAAERPGRLLEMIAARLAAQDRLPPARAFTAHEVLRHARLPEEAMRASLGQLASVSERIRYSGTAVEPDAVAATVVDGERVLAALAVSGPVGLAT